MGRPRLTVGDHGRIRLYPRTLADGSTTHWRAETCYRDQSGRTRRLHRVRQTQEAAIEALKEGVEVEAAKFGGVHVKGVRVRVVTPRADLPARCHALYRFYDKDGALLYVGITMSPLQRFKEHETDKPWWGAVVRIEIEDHPSYEAAREAERLAIRSEGPSYNIAS